MCEHVVHGVARTEEEEEVAGPGSLRRCERHAFHVADPREVTWSADVEEVREASVHAGGGGIVRSRACAEGRGAGRGVGSGGRKQWGCCGNSDSIQ